MAKKSRLKREEVERITGEKVYFEDTLCLLDGLLVTTDENGNMFTDENDSLTQDDVITVKFDKAVYDRITKYLRSTLSMRGIKMVDAIDENDPDVRELVRKWKKRSGSRFIKRSDELRQARLFVETVAAEHRPQYMTTFIQVCAWAIMYDDVFSVSGGRIEYRFDVEVKEEYWTGISRDESDADLELDKLISDYKAPEIVYDRTNPLEFMLAIVTAIMEEHPEFSESIASYFQRIYVAMNIMRDSSRFDDAGFLRSTLDELLSEAVDEADNDGERQIDASGSSGQDGKKVRAKRKQSGKPENEQNDEGDAG